MNLVSLIFFCRVLLILIKNMWFNETNYKFIKAKNYVYLLTSFANFFFLKLSLSVEKAKP